MSAMIDPHFNRHDTGGPWSPPAPGRYCLTRCYCGDCPHYLPMSVKSTNTPDAYTAIDRRAILSSTGRRTNLAEYRAAQREAAGEDAGA